MKYSLDIEGVKSATLYSNFDESVRQSPSLFLLCTLASAYPKIDTVLFY